MKNSIRFLPLLLLYISIVLIFSENKFWGDEERYVMFAKNLTEGYYSPSDPYRINLWNGPGYPLVLFPFVLLKLPLLTAKLLNPFLLFFAIIYFNNTLRLYMQERQATFFSYLLGGYWPFLRYIHRLLTEHLAIFLICGMMFHFCKAYHNEKNSRFHILMASFYLGFLALTKIIFGYVILSGLIIFSILYLWKKRDAFRKTFVTYSLALLLCVPYLLYTYNLTGKIFYWGNGGGAALYTMSSPYEDELGDLRVPAIFDSDNHRRFFEGINKKGLSNIELDEELKKQAIQNIINHPFKYFKNWMANIGRLLFNYPYSYDRQKLSTYFYLIPNMFFVVVSVLCVYPTYRKWSSIPDEIRILLIFGLIVFLGSSLVYAENRYSWPLVPVLFLWIFFVFSKIVKIDIRKWNSHV